MRRIFTRLLVAALTFALGLCLALLWRIIKGSPPPFFARAVEAGLAPETVTGPGWFEADRRVLFDKRDYVESESPYEEFKARGERQRELTQRLAPEVFSRPGLYHRGLCSEESRGVSAKGEADLRWARERGQFVPWVRGWHRGSFTGVRPDEILYELNAGECNARSGPLAGGSSQLAVFADGKLRASVNTLVGDAVYGVQDTDGDGVDEFLLASGDFEMTRRYVTTLRLVSLKDGGLRVVHDFGGVYVYECLDEVCRNKLVTIPVIYYTPGGAGRAAEYRVDFYRARCDYDEGCEGWPRPDAWEYYKSGSLRE